jgi:Uma2 family endonuclease
MSVQAARPVTYGQEASWARFSVGKYQQMIRTGILDEDDRVELLEGYVVLKMPRDPAHDGTIQRVQRTLLRYLPIGWDMRVQSAVELSDSQPEPDFAVARGSYADYMQRHPAPADIGLLIEVANMSLERDQKDKSRIYARAGVAAYWIINVVDRQVDRLTRPSASGGIAAYGDVHVIRPPDAVPLELDGAAVALIPAAELLP